uniref:Uncharacterized protein n=1 Tax=viral metagenome TaxID=1070528 RepID=A0A6C0AGA0_9ZZZZ
MQINILEIPDFLQDSEFYRNLDLNFNELITIPELKITCEINNITDFKNLFETLNFFGVNNFPNNFIDYYLNNSEEVFNSLNKKSLKFKILLINFCNLKIENHNQFFITYKIINLYKLQDYDNYIEYALNNADNLFKDNYFKDNKDNKKLVKKIFSTQILELKDYKIIDDNIHFTIKNKKLSEEYKKSTSIISIESVSKIIDAIKNNIDYEYDSKKKYFEKNIPRYKKNNLYLVFYKSFSTLISPIIINEFNKKIILKEFQKILEFINS